jgi:hypothetical protein
MSKIIPVNLNDVSYEIREDTNSMYHEFIDNCDSDCEPIVYCPKKCCNFQEKINSYEDVETKINTFNYWMKNSEEYIINFVTREKLIIVNNIINFVNFISAFELKDNIIDILSEDIYDFVINSNDNLELIKFLFDENLINNKFNNYVVKKLEIIETIRNEYNYIVPTFNFVILCDKSQKIQQNH